MAESVRFNGCGARLGDQTTGLCPSCGAELAEVGLYREPPINKWRASARAVIGVALIMAAAFARRGWLGW